MNNRPGSLFLDRDFPRGLFVHVSEGGYSVLEMGGRKRTFPPQHAVPMGRKPPINESSGAPPINESSGAIQYGTWKKDAQLMRVEPGRLLFHHPSVTHGEPDRSQGAPNRCCYVHKNQRFPGHGEFEAVIRSHKHNRPVFHVH